MIRRLISLIVKLFTLAIAIFILTVVWIIFDGVTDLGNHSDVALVLGHTDAEPATAKKHKEDRLERAAQLFKDGQFPYIIVSGAAHSGGENEADRMAHGLEVLGIPAGDIIIDPHGDNTETTARNVAEIMKKHGFHSVMIVTDYYHITRTKLALRHEQVTELDTAHAGALRKQDAFPIGREVVALYAYLGKYYLLPAAAKARDEAKTGLDQAKVEAEKAKTSVDKKLDNLGK